MLNLRREREICFVCYVRLSAPEFAFTQRTHNVETTSYQRCAVTGQCLFIGYIDGSRHAKTCLRAYADCDGTVQPGASAQSNRGLRCPQIESENTIECFNGEQMPG